MGVQERGHVLDRHDVFVHRFTRHTRVRPTDTDATHPAPANTHPATNALLVAATITSVESIKPPAVYRVIRPGVEEVVVVAGDVRAPLVVRGFAVNGKLSVVGRVVGVDVHPAPIHHEPVVGVLALLEDAAEEVEVLGVSVDVRSLMSVPRGRPHQQPAPP